MVLDSELDISREIERVRKRLVALGDELGFLHPEVMQCSEYLDELLLAFYARERQNKK